MEVNCRTVGTGLDTSDFTNTIYWSECYPNFSYEWLLCLLSNNFNHHHHPPPHTTLASISIKTSGHFAVNVFTKQGLIMDRSHQPGFSIIISAFTRGEARAFFPIINDSYQHLGHRSQAESWWGNKKNNIFFFPRDGRCDSVMV